MYLKLRLFVLFCCSFFISCELKKQERLPSNLIAHSYKIWIKPYFPAPGVKYSAEKEFTFDAKVAITVEATATADRFLLNSESLNITKFSVFDATGSSIPFHSINNDGNLLSLLPDSNAIINGSTYIIKIDYTGVITRDSSGVFYSIFKDSQGTEQYLVATDLEPSSARKVFPCLDEPSFKSRFSMEIEYPSSLIALSNMKETTPINHGNGWSTMKFIESPLMSTYLVAFTIGPFVHSEYINEHNTLSRVWGLPGTEDYLEYAVKTSGDCLYQLGEYTGVRFPLQKLDHVALPFFNGAMENWGLIFYQNHNLLYNPKTTPTSEIIYAKKTMFHEISHQWFGNLVTPESWNDLFLSEGFATYFATTVMKYVYPEQGSFYETYKTKRIVERSLDFDSLESSHPVVHSSGPSFDKITYDKAASLIWMLHDTMGPDVFQQGIQSYFKKHQYSTATNVELFSELTDIAQKNNIKGWCGSLLNVTDFVWTYFHKTGFPLVHITMSDTNNSTNFTHEPFTKNGNALKWNIPMRIQSLRNSSYHYTTWLTEEKCKTMDSVETQHFEIGLVESPLYGRIVYNDNAFDQIVQKVAHDDVDDHIKLKLLLDEIDYIRHYGKSYERWLRLAEAIVNAPSFMKNPNVFIFENIVDSLYDVSKSINNGEESESQLYQRLFGKFYPTLVWEDSGNWEKDMFLYSYSARAFEHDIGDIKTRTINMFAAVKNACKNSTTGTTWCNPYSPNVRPTIYSGVAKYSPANSDDILFLSKSLEQVWKTNPHLKYELEALHTGLEWAKTQ